MDCTYFSKSAKNDFLSFSPNLAKSVVKVKMSPCKFLAVKAVHEPFWTIQILMDKEDAKYVCNHRLFFYTPHDELFPFGFTRPVTGSVFDIIAALDDTQIPFIKRVFVYDPEADDHISALQLAKALST
jgi:hypothetical protein